MKLNLNKGKTLLLTIVSLVVAAGVAGYLFWGRRTTAEEYITAKVDRGTVRNTVSATGALQAVTTVQVGSQVSGNILALNVDFNSTVKRGQVVAQLDPSTFQAQVAQQRANLEQARASLADAEARVLAAQSAIENSRAGVSSANANVDALKAQRDDAKNNFQRMESLASSGVINQRDLESARATLQTAEARYNQAAAQLAQAKVSEQQAAKAGLAQAQAQVKQAQAQVQQTQASLRVAEVNLSHTTITSPIDGVVVSRNVDVGQTVAASLQAPTLFTIANDLTQMQVIANIDQADIGVINQSNRVNFTVDAYPGQNFNGTIRQIRLNPQNVQNVVTYNVVIDVDNPELKLKPGMTANLTMTIAERSDVLRVPNAALRFRPADVTPEKLREIMRSMREQQGGQGGAQGQQSPQSGAQGQPSPAGGAREKQPGQGAGQGGGREHNRANQPQADAGGNRQAGEGGGRRGGGGEGGMRRGGGGEGGAANAGEGSGRRGGEGGFRRGEGGEGGGRRGGGEGGARQAGETAGRQAGEGGGRRGGEGGARQPGNAGGQAADAGGQGGGRRGGGGSGGSGMMQTGAVVQGQTRIVWVLAADGKPQPRRIKLGITDGVNTEIAEGDLKEGDQVITAQNRSTSDARPQTSRPPGFGGGPGGGGFGGGGGGRGPR